MDRKTRQVIVKAAGSVLTSASELMDVEGDDTQGQLDPIVSGLTSQAVALLGLVSGQGPSPTAHGNESARRPGRPA